MSLCLDIGDRVKVIFRRGKGLYTVDDAGEHGSYRYSFWVSLHTVDVSETVRALELVVLGISVAVAWRKVK